MRSSGDAERESSRQGAYDLLDIIIGRYSVLRDEEEAKKEGVRDEQAVEYLREQCARFEDERWWLFRVSDEQLSGKIEEWRNVLQGLRRESG